MPATARILLLVMLPLPLWAFGFLPRPWDLYADGEVCQAVATGFAYYVLPVGLALAVLTRSFYFIGILALELAALLAHAAATAGAVSWPLLALRGLCAALFVGGLVLLANRDLLFPFFAHGVRRWRRSPRFETDERAELRRGALMLGAAVEDLSLYGLGLNIPAGGEALARGDQVRVTIGEDSRQLEVAGEIVWARAGAQAHTVGILASDPRAMRVAVQRFTTASLEGAPLLHYAALGAWLLGLLGALCLPALAAEPVVDPQVAALADDWVARLGGAPDSALLSEAVNAYAGQIATLDAQATSAKSAAEFRRRAATEEAFARKMGPALEAALQRSSDADPALTELKKDYQEAKKLEERSRRSHAAGLK